MYTRLTIHCMYTRLTIHCMYIQLYCILHGWIKGTHSAVLSYSTAHQYTPSSHVSDTVGSPPVQCSAEYTLSGLQIQLLGQLGGFYTDIG